MQTTKTTYWTVLFTILLFCLTSCSVVRKVWDPPLIVPETFSNSGSSSLPQKWWISFEDKQLNQLIEEGIQDNLTIREARSRLEQARAIARKSGSDLFPTLDGTAGLSRSATKNKGSSRQTFSSYSLGLAASYEVDFWGRIRATTDAATLDALAAREDLQAALITLSAEVATTWYRFVEQRSQIALLDEQITTKEKHLDLVTHQFRKGQAPATDVLQQRQTLEASKGDKIVAQASEKLLSHQLAVLLGKPPASFALADKNSLITLPSLPETGLTSDLIQRRPDIRRAYFRLQAADQRIGAAVADRFPRISLTGSTETSTEDINDLFDNWLASLAGSLIAPLVDGGRRRAEVERTEAAALEALNRYGQVILTSLKEVEDALINETQQSKLLQSIDAQIELSSQATEQTRERYIYGDMEFLRFLTTLLSHQSLERSHLKARRELIEYRINLCRALAGGWEMEDNEKTP